MAEKCIAARLEKSDRSTDGSSAKPIATILRAPKRAISEAVKKLL